MTTLDKGDKITMVCEEDINSKIDIILRQTDYSKEISREKLLKFDMDYIKVIKDYNGITEKKAPPVKSIQQQIYKEIRYRLDDSIKDFNTSQEKKLISEIDNNNNK